jgi:hypothetical protein
MGGMGPGEAVEVVGGVNGVGSGSVEIRSVEIRAKVRRDQSISVKIRKIASGGGGGGRGVARPGV